MSYYDSAEGVTIDQARAYHEIVVNHEMGEEVWEEFLDDMGEHDEYDAQAVLAWLGH